MKRRVPDVCIDLTRCLWEIARVAVLADDTTCPHFCIMYGSWGNQNRMFKLMPKDVLFCSILFSPRQILEFDSPAALLANESSRFRAMIEASENQSI